jgi:hypothetical protein
VEIFKTKQGFKEVDCKAHAFNATMYTTKLVEHHKIVLTAWKLKGFIKLHVNQVSKDTKTLNITIPLTLTF